MLTAASFVLLLIAAALCGAADGAWLAMARRHLRLSFFQALRTFLRVIVTGDACTWWIATAPQTQAAPPPPPAPSRPELLHPQAQIPPHPSLLAAHGARSIFLTAAVLVMSIVSIVTAPPLEQSWALIAALYPAGAVTAFLLTRTDPAAVTTRVITHGDHRAALAVLAMMLCMVLPDGRIDDLPHAGEPVPTTGDGPPDWLLPTLSEGLSLGLAPLPLALLLAASLMCGLADGAWAATAMRHLRLSFFQVLRLYLATARGGSGDTWRGETGDGP